MSYQLTAEYKTAYELRTANAIAVYQDNNLSARLNDAERIDLENMIIERVLGARNA